MNDITWIIEPEIFGDDKSLETTLHKLNVNYVKCKFGKSYENYFDTHKTMVFYGSDQLLKAAEFVKKSNNLSNWFLFNEPLVFDCDYYYPKFDDFLLNKDYEITICEKFFETVDEKTNVFLKSNSFKIWTGRLFHQSDIRELKSKFRFYPDELIVISSPKEIISEYRLVVFEKKIIAFTRYKPHPVAEVSQDVLGYAEKCLSEVDFNPSLIWTLDIAETKEGFHVIEVGPFSCCGLYKCDWEPIIENINNYIINYN